MTHASRRYVRAVLRWIAAAGFISTGVMHFYGPKTFVAIVPHFLPAPKALVQISGACEIAGGLGLLLRPLRRPAGWGLIALLVAVFPANVVMALYPERTPDIHLPPWMLWARLPLQAIFIAWVWLVSQPHQPRTK